MPATIHNVKSEISGNNLWDWRASFYTVDPKFYQNYNTDSITSSYPIRVESLNYKTEIASGQMHTERYARSVTHRDYFGNQLKEKDNLITFGFTRSLNQYLSNFYIRSLNDYKYHIGKTFYITKIDFDIPVNLQLQEWHYQQSNHTMTMSSYLWFSPAFSKNSTSTTSKGIDPIITTKESDGDVSNSSASELNFFQEAGTDSKKDQYAIALTDQNDMLAIGFGAELYSDFDGRPWYSEEDLYMTLSASYLNISLSGRWIDNAWNPPGISNNPWLHHQGGN